jgi:hypothetical protein
MMTMPVQPPEKTKETPPDKPGADLKQPPSKTDEKTAPSKDATPMKEQESTPGKDALPPIEKQQPVIPLAPPPGAQVAVPPKQQPKNFQIGSVLEPALWLIGILAVGAILIAWLRKNRDRQLNAAALTANDQLTAFRESMEQGDMTDEEFKKVKVLLSEKLRKQANPVTAAPGQAAQPGQAKAPSDPSN